MEIEKITGTKSINGISLYYEIYGQGEIPLVLIHGGGSTIPSNFGNLIPYLAQNNKLIAVELQAHGRTSDRDAAESFEQDATDVVTLLEHLDIAKANFLGFSNGGTTTLHIAVRYPIVVNKIVVISANYQRDGLIAGFYDGFGAATLEHMPEGLKKSYLELNPDPEGLQNMFEKDKQRMLNFIDLTDEEIAGIKADALLMLADRDVVTPEHLIKTSSLIENSRLVILPGIHGSMIGEICSPDINPKTLGFTTHLIESFLQS